MARDSRWDVPETGALISFSYRGMWGDIQTQRAVVDDLTYDGNDARVWAGDGSRVVLTFNPSADAYGTIEFDPDDVRELYEVREVVPRSQVVNPGVTEGDAVKIGTGSVAYRVESVDDGMASLEDGRTVPVTEITAFGEDVDDYDPFQRLPEWGVDFLLGGRK